MAMLYALLALCLCGSTLAQIITSGSCPDVQVQKNFSISKFTGRWFEQARYYALYQFRSDCGVFDYTVGENNTLKVVNTLSSSVTGKEKVFETAVVVPDRKQTAKVLLKIPMSPIEGYNNLWVLGTDYNNWAVVFSCNAICSMNMQYAWIMTRKRHPDESTMRKANKVVYKNNLEPAHFLPMEQKGCRKPGLEE